MTHGVAVDVHDQTASPTQALHHRHPWLGWLFLALALWMISPIFTSSYVEAYVARLQSMAILNHQGRLALDDQAYPINTELLYVTRLGMVWLLGGAMELLHSTSLWVLRLITMGSFALLVGSCVVFARRWARVPVWAVLASAVLVPGILEPSFFFADNLVSASLTALALALVVERTGFLRGVAIGATVALAMLIRLDAMLIVPAVLAVLWLARRTVDGAAAQPARRGSGLPALLLAGVLGAAVIFALSQAVTGVSLLTAYKVGRLFGAVNNNTAIYQTGLWKTRELIFFGFFGLVALPLVALGAWENWKLHGRRWTLVMTVLPILFYCAVIPHANEIRDFCIMGAPFVLLHVATGLSRLLAMAEGPRNTERLVARLLFAAFALIFVAPPYISMRDGPRALTGRLYTPIFWRQWQGRTLDMVAQIHGLVDEVRPGEQIVVVTSQFEPDRYLHLRLLQEGFTLDPVAAEPGGCQSVERFHRDGRTVYDVRTENPYGIIPGEHAGDYLESMQIAASLQCLHGQPVARAYFFSIGDAGQAYWPGLTGPELAIPRRFFLPQLHHAHYGFFGNIPLTPSDLQRLEKAAAASRDTLAGSKDVPDEEALRRLVQTHFWHPAE